MKPPEMPFLKRKVSFQNCGQKLQKFFTLTETDQAHLTKRNQPFYRTTKYYPATAEGPHQTSLLRPLRSTQRSWSRYLRPTDPHFLKAEGDLR